MHFDIPFGKEVDANFIAGIRYELKVAHFLYKRKKARWLSLFNKIESLLVLPVKYTKEDL